MMKQKIKKALLKRLLSDKQYQKIYAKDILFPGGVVPIQNVSDNDVFIIGFPKSGNTLMQHIITHLVYGINKEGSRSMVNLIAPDIYANSHYFRFNERCFFKSHDLPKKEYRKVLYIMRDGRAALSSYSKMMDNLGTPTNLEDLYSGKIKLFNATWSEHIKAWEENQYNAEILWLKFEDVVANKKQELLRICEFLNIERSEQELDEVVKYTSLDHMKELEEREDWVRMKKEVNFNKGSFVRSGKVWTDHNRIPNHVLKSFEEINKFTLSKFYDS